MKISLSAFLSSMLASAVLGLEDWKFSSSEVKLPKALSDHSAARASDGKIYIAGGCDDVNGNVWNGDAQMFFCNSVSDAAFSFDPETNLFKTLANLPRQRYRHSSAVINNQVWIVGGRTLVDDLIPEIDVYDIASGEWSTVGSLPLQYQVSDHAGFAKDDAVYIAGGYTTADYIAVGTVLKIDSDVKFTEVKSLTAPRGDVFGVASDDGTSAFVAGGFTNEDWCSPLDTVEKYTFASDTWVDLPKLATARAEVLLVENDNHLYSLGGEYPLYELCNTSEGITDVGSKTVGTDKVEILMDGEGEWKFLESFPEQLFRFAAVGAAEKDKIYVFGGQTKYEASCECTKTTDHVWVFEKPEDAAAGNHISLFAAFVASVSTFFLMYA